MDIKNNNQSSAISEINNWFSHYWYRNVDNNKSI